MAFASGIAAGVAPLGQRVRGVFRLPPSPSGHPSPLDGLWLPAYATALEWALHPAGHGPNNSSLFLPQAVVVVVALG